MKHISKLSVQDDTMEENSPLKISFNTLKIMVSKDNFHLPRLLNRMEWYKGKTEEFKKLQEPC
jgi:hypothetical protein